MKLYMFRTVRLSIIGSLFTVHSAMVRAGLGWNSVPSWPCSKSVYKPVWHIPLLSIQWINSRWWTDELPETCRVSCQNKFVKLVNVVGFIIKSYGFYSFVLGKWPRGVMISAARQPSKLPVQVGTNNQVVRWVSHKRINWSYFAFCCFICFVVLARAFGTHWSRDCWAQWVVFFCEKRMSSQLNCPLAQWDYTCEQHPPRFIGDPDLNQMSP